MEENIFNTIRHEYKIENCIIEKRNDSTDGNVYTIFDNQNKFIAKIYKQEEHTKSMINLHLFLIKSGFIVPNIVKNINGDYYCNIENNYIVVYTFINGEQYGPKIENIENIEYKNNIVRKLAIQLRKLHEITRDNNFNLKEIEIHNSKKENERKSVLHFDLTKDNIFICKDKIGFIDFDDAKYGDSLFDVASVICFLFISKKRGVDENSINVFLNSYYNNETEVKRREIHMIKTYAHEWIKEVLKNENLDKPIKESFIFKDKMIRKINIGGSKNEAHNEIKRGSI